MINPIAFYIPIINWPVHWYGLAYAIGVLITIFWLPSLLSARNVKKISAEQVWDMVFWIFVAGVIGGRLGEWLFYHPEWIKSPLEIIKIWRGGMSFHGGLIGGAIGAYFMARRYKISLGKLGDAMVIPLCISFGLGRIANFINSELVGRVTSLPIGVYFPGWVGKRHPSQLYEAAKNFLLAVVLLFPIYKSKKLADGALFALWMIGYGVLRFAVEFFRQPDWIFLNLSSGQWLSSVMIIIGIGALFYLKKKTK